MKLQSMVFHLITHQINKNKFQRGLYIVFIQTIMIVTNQTEKEKRTSSKNVGDELW